MEDPSSSCPPGQSREHISTFKDRFGAGVLIPTTVFHQLAPRHSQAVIR